MCVAMLGVLFVWVDIYGVLRRRLGIDNCSCYFLGSHAREG